MNRLRSHKFKLNSAPDVPEANNNNNSSSSNSNNGSGLLNNSLINKISKRYSTLSSKITRRSQTGRRAVSPQKVISGSYDMTGSLSEDHRLEIGAPVLISSTTLDAERFDVSEERLKMIGGGIAATNCSKIKTIDLPINSNLKALQELEQNKAIHSSSGSENEIFVDALSSTPVVVVTADGGEQQEKDVFEMAFETPQKIVKREELECASPSSEKSSDSDMTPVNQMSNYYETTRTTNHQRPKSILAQKAHSQSAQNLHRSEIKVYLQKAPSMNLMEKEDQIITANMEEEEDIENMALPKLPELYGQSKCDLAATTDNELNADEDDEMTGKEEEDNDADKENSSPSVVAAGVLKSKSEPNTPFFLEPKRSSFLSQKKLFQSAENIHQRRTKRRSVVFSSSTSINHRNGAASGLGSKNSLCSQASLNFDDYDLKSVSCQSLNPQSLFVSIDELNEITRQINESEDFNQDIDLEYCMHRDQLKPSERRITLLKNKNARLINFTHNKQKLKKGWTGVKHWIGEEGHKIREVVQRQPLVQRIGSSKLNLSNAECRNSPSLNGSTVLRQAASRGASQDKSLDESSRESKMTSSMHLYDSQCLSSDNIAADSSNELNDSLEAEQSSPGTKKPGQEGQNGFEELRRYVKQGGDFGKELIVILQERIDSELLYSKSLSKMANKLNKACRELPGTIADAWRGVATEMETRSDIHRQLSASLAEEVVKPLKSIVEGHHKTRKSVESNVDKAARVLAEWRASEAKGKKASHTAARENEKLQDAMLDVRIQKSPSIALLHQSTNKQAAEKEIKLAEKDCAKLDNKRKKAEEAVKKADVEYYTLCIRAERARVDWEMAVLRGSSLLQNIENQRLINMKNFVSNYAALTANMNPIMESLMQRLQPQVDNCNVVKDMQIIKNIRRNAEGPSEQLLPDFYCEHTTLAMNRERRKHALVKLLQLVKTDLERERRSRNGLKGLSQSLNSQEHQNITDKLYHIRSMLTYLEGARFKLHSALLELDHKPRSSHPLAQHIQITRDRTGLQQSILKVPLWLKNNDKISNPQCGDDPNNDYDSMSQSNTTTSTTNISCVDGNGSTDGNFPMKNFNRSKSNIETFSNKAKVCVATNAAAVGAVNGKNKTLSGTTANIYDDACSDDRGQADGGSNQQDSDFDEFSSQDEDEESQLTSSTTTVGVGGRKEHKANIEKSLQNAENYYQNSIEIKQEQQQQQQYHIGDNNTTTTVPTLNESSTPHHHVVLGRCKALYNYTPKLYDELELIPGDIIEVHAKQEDGWWLGALRNQVGIFPATYVEEIA